MICLDLLLSIIGNSIVLSPETFFLQSALMKHFLVVVLINAVMAALIFEETKSNDSCDEFSDSLSTIEPTPLVNRIFDEPFLAIISEFIPFPQSKCCVVNCVTRAHFNKEHFFCWSKLIPKTLNIPGIVSASELKWFYTNSISGGVTSEFLQSLLRSLVNEKIFPINYKAIIEFLLDNLRLIDNVYLIYSLSMFISHLEDYNFSIDILHKYSNFISVIYNIVPAHDRLAGFMEALKSHSKFEEVYATLINFYSFSSESFYNKRFRLFLAHSLAAKIPQNLFLEKLFLKSWIIFESSRIALSIVPDESRDFVYESTKEIIDKLSLMRIIG
jgi:hypothetical protein